MRAFLTNQKKKNMSRHTFFNDDDAVKSIKKASNRLRPGGTLCMMPKYVDAIEGRLKFCSTSSVIGLCNRKGNDSTSCRALWKKLVSPEEQETFLSKLHTLTAADLEEFQHKFGEAMMLRIYGVYDEEKHTDTLGYNQGLNELRESVEKLKIDRWFVFLGKVSFVSLFLFHTELVLLEHLAHPFGGSFFLERSF